MSVGMILLVVLAVLLLFGIGQRVLDRMRLNDKQALLFIALIFCLVLLAVDVAYAVIDPRLRTRYIRRQPRWRRKEVATQ